MGCVEPPPPPTPPPSPVCVALRDSVQFLCFTSILCGTSQFGSEPPRFIVEHRNLAQNRDHVGYKLEAVNHVCTAQLLLSFTCNGGSWA